jgi:hypothetical protein
MPNSLEDLCVWNGVNETEAEKRGRSTPTNIGVRRDRRRIPLRRMLAEHRAALPGQLVALIVRELARLDFGVIPADFPFANPANNRLLMAFSAACTVEQRPKSVRSIKGALKNSLVGLEARELGRRQAGQRITNFRWRPTDACARTRRHDLPPESNPSPRLTISP